MSDFLPNLVDVTARVVKLVESAGSQAAASRMTGIATNTMSRLCRGENEPGAVTLARFAQGMGVSLDWLMFGGEVASASDDQAAQDRNFVGVPLLDVRIAAGSGGFNSDHIGELETIPFPARFITKLGGRPDRVRFFRPSGRSMEPTITDGALVMFDHSQNKLPTVTKSQPVRDSIWVFIQNGDEALVKRLRPLEGGFLAVMSDNFEVYRQQILNPREAARVKIIGKAIWWDNRLSEGWMRAVLVAAAMVVACSVGAQAQQSLASKACILNSATRLPSIPGLQIVGSTATDESITPTIRQQVDLLFGRDRPRDFLIDLGSTIDVLSKIDAMITQGGGYDRVRQAVLQEALKRIKQGLRVEVTVTAAGVNATYAFACAVLDSAAVRVYTLGLAR